MNFFQRPNWKPLYLPNRLRRGEVEPKPTLVALSPGNSGKRSSTGESEGLSDNENSTSYDETDGDTDGERLVTGNPVSVSGTGDDVCTIYFLVSLTDLTGLTREEFSDRSLRASDVCQCESLGLSSKRQLMKDDHTPWLNEHHVDLQCTEVIIYVFHELHCGKRSFQWARGCSASISVTLEPTR